MPDASVFRYPHELLRNRQQRQKLSGERRCNTSEEAS
jgi:hypothetical protein